MRTRIGVVLPVLPVLSRAGLAQGSGVGTRINPTTALGLNQGPTGQFSHLIIPEYQERPAAGKITLVFHLRGYVGERSADHMKHLTALHITLGQAMGRSGGGRPGRVFFTIGPGALPALAPGQDSPTSSSC
jgi:hypothetical protein